MCGVFGGDHETVGMDIAGPRTTARGPQIFHECSITDTARVSKIIEREKPGVVIHAAAWTDVDGCELDPEKAYEVNASGTENVARAAGAGRIPLVFISTDFVFDGEKGEPYNEDDAPRQISVYGRTKREAEEAVQRAAQAYAIVRSSWLFGKNGRNFVDTVVAKARAGERLKVVADQIGSPTFVKDLAGALERLIKVTAVSGQEVYHVSNSGRCSWHEFAVRILAEAGMADVTVEAISSADLDRPAKRPAFSVLDCSKFEKAAGYKLRPWEDALKEYIRERYG